VGEFITKITSARSNSQSLRTTIPEGIVKIMNVNAGDSLFWKISINKRKLEVIVSKKDLNYTVNK
jgi:hypothetical protein